MEYSVICLLCYINTIFGKLQCTQKSLVCKMVGHLNELLDFCDLCLLEYRTDDERRLKAEC